MKKIEDISCKFESLSELHKALSLPKPLHPLISLVDNSENSVKLDKLPNPHVLNFYKISYKTNLTGKLRYGQHFYDFNEGGLLFASPNQVVAKLDNDENHAGYTLLIHPDFLLTYPLAKKIKQYGFFSYAANEALHLSENEKTTILSIFDIIKQELDSRIDEFSQDVLVSQLELLLNYSNRFYKRQFTTRKAAGNNLLQKVEEILEKYFTSQQPLSQGIPTVQYISECLNFSPNYLSDMLRSLVGHNTQQHIHYKLIETAKEKLSASSLSISEVAYELGFEHPQSFSKFFKTKTNLSPLAFRRSFN